MIEDARHARLRSQRLMPFMLAFRSVGLVSDDLRATPQGELARVLARTARGLQRRERRSARLRRRLIATRAWGVFGRNVFIAGRPMPLRFTRRIGEMDSLVHRKTMKRACICSGHWL
jgi:hypothetical protein